MRDREYTHWREVDRSLRALARRRAALDAEELRLLVMARRAGVHRELGFGSFVEYATRTLGYSTRTAHERIRVAEALTALPLTRAALADGRLSFCATRELSRVATAETEAAWIAAASARSVREIEAMVAGHARGDLPDDPPDPDLEPRILPLKLAPHVYALFLEARRHLETAAGESLTDDDVVAAMCERTLGGDPRDRAPYQVEIVQCPTCARATQDAGGQTVHVDAARVATASVPAQTRKQVLRRDHHRCTVPGCANHRWLHVHHLDHQAHGGGHDPANLTTLCSTHHRAHHDGRLRIRGAPGGLVFFHRDGTRYGART